MSDEQSNQETSENNKVTPAGRKITYLGRGSLSPEEDAEVTRMIDQAEADIAQRRVQREQDQSNQKTPPLTKITPRGKFNKYEIEHLGDVTLTPELDDKIDRMTAQADAEIAEREARRKQNQ